MNSFPVLYKVKIGITVTEKMHLKGMSEHNVHGTEKYLASLVIKIKTTKYIITPCC